MFAMLTNRTSPNQNARPAGARPRFIVIHYWGERGQKFENVVSWLCNGKRSNRTSAHYVAEAGRVACIVSPDRRAWHAGSSDGNNYGIGIECRPEATDGDYQTVAELVRDLRARYGDLPLRPHKAFTSTDCPGPWDLARLDRLARGTGRPAGPPAFPLPAGYYYGPADGPRESVSGTGPNSGAGSDVTRAGGRWHSAGLRTWQERMRERGWTIEPDGRYGPQTARVARQFKARRGWTDGRIGPETWVMAWTEPVT